MSDHPRLLIDDVATAYPYAIVFSSRASFDRRLNRLSVVLEEKRRSGARLLDLTESNPTRVGLPAPTALLAHLAAPEAARYDPNPMGLAAARAAVAADMTRHGVDVSVEHVVLTASTSEAYALLFKLLCDPGDAVLVPEPSYPLFGYLAQLESVRTTPYPLSYDGEWRLDPAALRDSHDARCRAVIAVHPNNPTGSFLKRDEAEALDGFCSERGMALIADEVFIDYTHGADPRRMRSLAVSEKALVFSLGGLSKSCGLPQMKLGWIIAGGPPHLRDEALARLEIIADTYLSVGTPIQLAAPSLLARRGELQAPIAQRIGRNLRRLSERLDNDSSPLSLMAPEGGWSAILKAPATLSEDERVVRLLEERDVLVHPGFFFDFPREAFIVLSLLPQPEVFEEALDRIIDDFS